MPKEISWARRVVSGIFFYRYAICFFVILFILLFGFYLHYCRVWIFKDIVQVCSSFFIVLTLFSLH